MKQPVELARRYLSLADRDIKTFRLLADVPDSDDAAVGFHAQQAAEKCLKAVLSFHKIPFRKTHNLDELVDLLEDHKKPAPPTPEMLDALNPFAVALRYDLIEMGSLDRNQTRKIVEAVRRWAGEQVR